MDAGLHILLADPDPQQAALLGRYLVDQGHQVQTTGKGAEVINLIKRRRQEQRPVELLLIGRDLRGTDGIDVLDHLQGIDQPPTIVFIEPLEGLDAATTARLRSLGCRRTMNSPVDLSRLQKLLGELQGHGATADAPFFGTTRMTRRGDTASGAHERPHSASLQRPVGDTPGANPFDEADAAEEQERRQGGLGLQPAGREPASDTPPRPSSTGHSRPRTGIYSTGYRRRGTGTVRRSITGRLERETKTIAAGSRDVRCAHCGESFSVPRRSEEFNVMCIHCSKLNRIPAAFPPKPPNEG